jgi:hypothetical protein
VKCLSCTAPFIWHGSAPNILSSRFPSVTILGELMNRDLEDVLHRLALRLGGSKYDRIERIINHLACIVSTHTVPSEANHATADPPQERTPVDSKVLASQSLFRQKASNPQASLQPWLEQLLDGTGLVRCYATEDANPTKQLKNKLSQAAAARGGLLVLMLADDSSFSRAREALLQRWMANAEWPKSVACVALAHPLAAPTIEAIIERTDSPWAQRLRTLLFPSAEVFRVKSDEPEPPGVRTVSAMCGQCGDELPSAARFCPHCGRTVS